MDGAQAGGLYVTDGAVWCVCERAPVWPRRVGGRGARCEALLVRAGGSGSSADLGGSSNDSNEREL